MRIFSNVSLSAMAFSLFVCSVTHAAVQTYDIRPTNAKNIVRFTSDAPLELIQGETRKIQGTVKVDPDALTQGKASNSIQFTVDLSSLDTGIPLRNEHLRDNYLETAKFPKASFKVEKLTPLFKGPVKVGQILSFKAQGPFTLHGKTIEKTIPVSVINQGATVRIQSQFPVSLADFDIPRPEIVNQKLAETIFVNLDLLGVKVAPKAPLK